MALLVVALAIGGWIALDAAFVGVLILLGQRRERHVRALATSLVVAAERYTGEAAAPAGPTGGLSGERAFRGPTP
jgi:hypothetical protein